MKKEGELVKLNDFNKLRSNKLRGGVASKNRQIDMKKTKVVKHHLPTNRWSGEWQVINHILVMEVRKGTKEMKRKRKGNKVSKKKRKKNGK